MLGTMCQSFRPRSSGLRCVIVGRLLLHCVGMCITVSKRGMPRGGGGVGIDCGARRVLWLRSTGVSWALPSVSAAETSVTDILKETLLYENQRHSVPLSKDHHS